MERKIRKLQKILERMGKIVVAFSGGIDSSVLLKIAADRLEGKNLLAVSAVSPIHPAWEKREAVRIARLFKVKHLFIATEELKDTKFISNAANRCFYCKKELFEKMEQIRQKYGFNCIADGTNIDDFRDFRPGEQAKKMYGVCSPLKEAGLTKNEIRRYAKNIGLPFWDKPSMSCLSSRIPYGQKISLDRLKRIEKGESFLKSLGFRQVRIRDYGYLARIEVSEDKLKDAVKMKERISRKLKKTGYTYITLDLEGFRSGSMNKQLENMENNGR